MPEYQQTKKASESKSNIQTQTTIPKQISISNPIAIIQRSRINPKSLTHADVMQLQRTIGNQAVGRLLSEIGLIPSKAKQARPVQMQTIPEEKKEPLQGKFAEPLQRQEIPEEEEPLQGKFESIQRQEIPEEEGPLQRQRENNTGMPNNLKAGVENLSGIDMSDVRVHYNSLKPAEVGALAYTQGTNIHIAPGQERHLPHEAWHVVQQAQARVRPTMQLKGLAVNDDTGLEREADEMGLRASNSSRKGASDNIPNDLIDVNSSFDAIMQRYEYINSNPPKRKDSEIYGIYTMNKGTVKDCIYVGQTTAERWFERFWEHATYDSWAPWHISKCGGYSQSNKEDWPYYPVQIEKLKDVTKFEVTAAEQWWIEDKRKRGAKLLNHVNAMTRQAFDNYKIISGNYNPNNIGVAKSWTPST